MINKLLIVGCGLIGSSILKASIQKKISKNFFVFEKSKKYKSIIKKFNKKIKFLTRLDKNLNKTSKEILK